MTTSDTEFGFDFPVSIDLPTFKVSKTYAWPKAQYMATGGGVSGDFLAYFETRAQISPSLAYFSGPHLHVDLTGLAFDGEPFRPVDMRWRDKAIMVVSPTTGDWTLSNQASVDGEDTDIDARIELVLDAIAKFVVSEQETYGYLGHRLTASSEL